MRVAEAVEVAGRPTAGAEEAATDDARDEALDRSWRWTPAILLAATAGFALVVLTAGFYRSSWMLGDIAYHRGVAYTMQAGLWQGEGPFAGLITYYGGLYPLGLGLLAELRPFDTVLSVVSWPATLLMPLAFLLLGTRLYGRDPLAIAMFVLLGTVGAPLHSDRSLVWVDSVLPMGSAFWPLYPRDVALSLLIVGFWAATSDRPVVRVVVTGIVVGLTATFHAQMALLLSWFVAVTFVAKSLEERSPRRFGEGVAAAAIALVAAAWWWLPRVAAVGAGGILLADYPGREPMRLDPVGFIQAFGIVGILAIFGFALMVALWRTHPSWPLIATWLAAFLPLVLLNRAVPSIELVTERRIWLVASIGLVALAANASILVARAIPRRAWRIPLPRAAGAWLVALAVVAMSVPGTQATSRVMRGSWAPGNLGAASVDPARWLGVTAEIHRVVEADGPTVLGTYDAYAVWAWSFTGAQVPSAWLPGPIKLGFDPERLTGSGYLERVRRVEAAFDRGPAGICALRTSDGVDVLLLDASGGLVGSYDRTVGSPYRVEPRDRSEATILRTVGPGLTYVDQNSWDMLRLDLGASIELPWDDRGIRRLIVEARRVGGGSGPLLEVRSGADSYLVYGEGGRFQRLVADVDGLTGLQVVALDAVDITRITGFAAWPGTQPASDGLFAAQADEACSGIG
jgi:hypothetical protein